ncbi:MAG TPA: hypothetical protein ENN17_07880 [bacterium]|nr:hypothetical protein [bacterium]
MTSRKKQRRLTAGVLLLFLPVFSPASTGVPSGKIPFHTVHVGSHGLIDTNRNRFHRYWQSRGGIDVFAESPFYAGRIQLGFQYMPFSAVSDRQPSFNSLFVYADWKKEWRLSRTLACFLGGRAGFCRMRFDRSASGFSVHLMQEQEFAAGLCSGLHYAWSEKWRLSVTGVTWKIFTHERIHLAFLSMGLSRRFNTPPWLRKFLE